MEIIVRRNVIDADEKARNFAKLMDKFAESGAKSFEKFLMEHQNATMEEKHDHLVKSFHASMMLALMSITTI